MFNFKVHEAINSSLTYTIICRINIPQRFPHYLRVSPFMLASLAPILYLLRHKVSISAHFVSGLAGLSSLTEAAVTRPRPASVYTVYLEPD